MVFEKRKPKLSEDKGKLLRVKCLAVQEQTGTWKPGTRTPNPSRVNTFRKRTSYPLTVKSLVRKAFSLGTFWIFPGPVFLLMHY